MSWKKHFRVVNVPNANNTKPSSSDGGASHGSGSKFSSYLPEIYAGHPNRIQRYMQYDDMDRDSVINAALDTIADFCTQSEEHTDSQFEVNYLGEANETEVKILKASLQKWTRLNDFRQRLWYIFRGVIKNGDQFFVRDPETKEWLWVDHFNVDLVKVDESKGREPVEYIVRNLDYNKQAKLATKPANNSDYGVNGVSAGIARGPLSTPGTGAGTSFNLAGSDALAPRGSQPSNEVSIVDAKHVIHLSLSVGMDNNWPFGSSILESVFKVFKQKELLEDAVIIYRVQRAPERRIFKIDVGNMNPVMANAHIERIKNEIHQRRIPNRDGGGSSIMDAAYNPLSMLEDYFFAVTPEGRGSTIDTLPGGELTGEIGDLEFFNKKLKDALRIPSAYLPGVNEQGSTYNDGKLGAAMIQEFRFNKYCMRLQSLLSPVFDREFKNFLKESGIVIEEGLFELNFNPPQNFAKYRQVDLDSAQMSVYSQVADNKRLSERFKLKRFLNLTEDELLENERMWAEENPNKIKAATGATEMGGGDGLSSVGVRSGGDEFGDFGDEATGDDATDEIGGDEGTEPAADNTGEETTET